MPNNIKRQILKMKNQYLNMHYKQPKTLFLTPKEEEQIGALTTKDIAGLADEISNHGVREAIEGKGNQIFGMQIEWDADKFRVE